MLFFSLGHRTRYAMVRGDMLPAKAAGEVPSSVPVAAGENAPGASRNIPGTGRSARGARADPAWAGVLAVALILALVVATGITLAVTRSLPGPARVPAAR